MKKLLFIPFFLLLQLVSAAQTAPAFWSDIVAFKKQDSVKPPPSHAILFVGSSSFTRWTDVADYFPGYTIINRGFGGSTLVDVIRYAYDVILPYNPKQVVIYCGENDLASSDTVSAAEVVRRFKTLYAIIHTNLPSARIDFVSIKPSPSRIHLYDKMTAANNAISAFLKKEKNTGFINIVPAMLDASGKPREELFVADRLHMKPEGYKIWQKIMKPYLLK
jgi:lysophospholipase L1-like esterase